MKLKKLQDQAGESLCWSDYLSLPFTQTVRQPWLAPHQRQVKIIHNFHLTKYVLYLYRSSLKL